MLKIIFYSFLFKYKCCNISKQIAYLAFSFTNIICSKLFVFRLYLLSSKIILNSEKLRSTLTCVAGTAWTILANLAKYLLLYFCSSQYLITLLFISIRFSLDSSISWNAAVSSDILFPCISSFEHDEVRMKAVYWGHLLRLLKSSLDLLFDSYLLHLILYFYRSANYKNFMKKISI